MILPDVNILLYAYDADSPFHKDAKEWLEESLSGSESVAWAWHTIVGFLRIGTNPHVFKAPLTITEAIEMDVEARRLHLDVSDEELAKRREGWVPELPHAERGYYKLYIDHVMGADKGAGLDFLVGKSGTHVTRDSH